MIQGTMTESKRLQSGDNCPIDGCGGALCIRNSFQVGSKQVGYLECSICGQRPDGNKVIRDAGAIRRRRRN